MPPSSLLVQATTSTSMNGSAKSGSSSQSEGSQPKISRSTGRGGHGNQKRIASAGYDPAAAQDVHAMTGREAPIVIASSSKKMVSGRGGSGNTRALGYKSSKTAALVVQYEGPIRNYERDLIAASAMRRQQNIGASGRGGSGNRYLDKVKTSRSSGSSPSIPESSSSASRTGSTINSHSDNDSSLSSDAELSPSRRRHLLVPSGFISKFKLGKGSKSKGLQESIHDPYGPSLPLSNDAASTIGIRSPSIVISSAYSSSMASTSEVDSFFFSDTGTIASSATTIPLESEVEEEDARQRFGLMLIQEADEADDDESIYLAYARDDNHGHEEDEGLDTISEASEDILSEMDDGASVCLKIAELHFHDAAAKLSPEPSTPRASEANLDNHPSFVSSAYPPPRTLPHSISAPADEEDDVDPSLRIMRARYSMARYYRDPLTPSHSGSQRDLGAATSFSAALYHPSSTMIPASSPTPPVVSQSHCTSSSSAFQDVKRHLPPVAASTDASSPAELWAYHHLPTHTSIHSSTHPDFSAPTYHPTLNSHYQSSSRISLLSATDFAANDDTGEDLPPYTPNDVVFGISPTRARPLPSVPEVSTVDRLLNLPSVPLDVPRGPRRPPRLRSSQSEHRRGSVAEFAEMSWPSPPNSSPRHRPLMG